MEKNKKSRDDNTRQKIRLSYVATTAREKATHKRRVEQIERMDHSMPTVQPRVWVEGPSIFREREEEKEEKKFIFTKD